MSARGFTLIELLLATMVLLVVTGAMASLAIPARAAVTRSLAVDEMGAGARAALELIAAETRHAGANAAVGDSMLAAVTPVVSAIADLDSDTPGSPSRAIRLLTVPHNAPQGTLLTPLDAAQGSLQLATTSQCPAFGPACGFLPDMTIVISDRAHAEFVTVRQATPAGVLFFEPAVTSSFAAGAVVSAIEIATYGVRADTDGAFELIRVSPGGAIQPVLRHVVEFEVSVSAMPAIAIRLRVQASSAALRGPAGALFRRAGHARHASQWVPDYELVTTIAARNVTP